VSPHECRFRHGLRGDPEIGSHGLDTSFQLKDPHLGAKLEAALGRGLAVYEAALEGWLFG
jgi:hypothetical protein